jgi:replicative superfamily II helicase
MVIEMDKIEFMRRIQEDIARLLKDPKLINNKNQLFAWKLNSRFKRTFDEDYLWNQALFLSTNSCLLLQENTGIKLAYQGLFSSAEIFQYLSESNDFSKPLDKDYFLILAALCYDIAGYQANAFCLVNSINIYELNTQDGKIDLTIDNRIIDQIRLVLLKKIPLAEDKLKKYQVIQHDGFNYFYNAMIEWYALILKQKGDNYLSNIEKAYNFYLVIGNTYLSHLTLLWKTRIRLFNERSIYLNLRNQMGSLMDYQWKKYVRLLTYDYYEKYNIKLIENRNSIFEFWTSQLRAIENGLLTKDENFIVQMPTSSGKTFIAELLILKYLNKYPSKKCLYIAPFRALTNEKENELGKYFTKLGYIVSSLSGSYEIDSFQDVILAETNLLIATPEKIDCLLRFIPEYFNEVSLIVVDEGHIISDFSSRATLLEFLIIRLRIKIPEVKTLFISAVMPPKNANEYSLWLSGKDSNVLRAIRFSDSDVFDEWEPTKKLISSFEEGNIIFKDIRFEDEKDHTKIGAILNSYLKPEFENNLLRTKIDIAAALAFKLSSEGGTLVFCAQPRYVESAAKALLKILENVSCPDRFMYDTNKESSYYANIWYGNNSKITKAIDRGIGIHFGDMPEQVRMAVENDFKNGRLAVLLSTNTIGQGLNFPIKNLIFYSLQIGERKDYIKHRDFWNIVGRAGRAGKETEGKIIFIINSYNDRKLFNEFTVKDNIENAESLFLKALTLRLSNNIKTDDEFYEKISQLSETYLLDLLAEEIIGTDYEELIEKIIQNSLFKTQIDNRNLDISLIKSVFKRILEKISNESKIEDILEYKKTGLSFQSNKLISDFIKLNIEEIKIFVEDGDYVGIIKCFIYLLDSNLLPELTNNKLRRLLDNNHRIIDYLNIIIDWVNGMALAELIDNWNNTLSSDISSFHILLSQGLCYLFPWGMTAFLILIAYEMRCDYKDLPDTIKAVPSYFKYGQNNSTACLARSLGIKSRDVATMLCVKSNYLTRIDFIRWLSNLTYDEISSFDINNFDIDNITDVVLRITPSGSNVFMQEYVFELKGTIYNPDWSIESKKLKLNDFLVYRRDNKNLYDPFAIIILHENNPVGYIPRDYAKKLSAEIDVEEKSYIINVARIDPSDTYNRITVRMRENVVISDYEV